MMIGSVKANSGARKLDRHEIASGERNLEKAGED